MTSSWPHHNVILSNILRKLYLDIYFFVFSIVFFFLSTIIVRKKQKQKIHICYFHFFFSCFQILFFTLCTLILINESIIMFGYSMQSLQINCSFLWSFLHTNFRNFEYFVFNLWSSFSLSVLQDSYQQQLPHI